MIKNGSSYITAIAFFIGLSAIYLLTLKGGIIPALLFACLPAIAHGYSQILPETVLLLRLFCHKLRHHWN